MRAAGCSEDVGLPCTEATLEEALGGTQLACVWKLLVHRGPSREAVKRTQRTDKATQGRFGLSGSRKEFGGGRR